MNISLREATIELNGTRALTNFSGTFTRGTVSALIGGDGAGKSTLLRGIAGHVPFSTHQDLSPSSQSHLGYQPADSGVWRNLSVDENIDFVTRVYGLDKDQAAQRSTELLARAGLEDVRKRVARNLSGGMRQKLGFILATLHRPDLVLLDEPTTGVDPASRAELWWLIGSSAADGATVIVATSYLDEAERAHELFFLSQGNLIASGTPDNVIAQTPGYIWTMPHDNRNTGHLQTWRRAQNHYFWTRRDKEPAIPAGAYQESLDLENSAIAHLLAEESRESQGDATPPIFPVSDVSDQRHTLVEADNVTRSFGHFNALLGVSVNVRPGEVVGLLGGNGAGKTTLMRIMLGLDVPSSGTAMLFGHSPSPRSRELLGYVAQGLGLYPSLSALENLKFAATVHKTDIDGEMWRFGDSFGDVRVGALSLGTQRMLAYLTTLLHYPELLVLDEPTSGMDALNRARLWSSLHEQADSGVGILVTTHYMQEAAQCDRLVILSEGQIVATGSADEITAATSSFIVTTEYWQEAFRLLQRAELMVTLSGRALRIIDSSKKAVLEALETMRHPFEISASSSTLEEIMTVRS